MYEDEDLDVEELQAGAAACAACYLHLPSSLKRIAAEPQIQRRMVPATQSKISKMQRFLQQSCHPKGWFHGLGQVGKL